MTQMPNDEGVVILFLNSFMPNLYSASEQEPLASTVTLCFVASGLRSRDMPVPVMLCRKRRLTTLSQVLVVNAFLSLSLSLSLPPSLSLSLSVYDYEVHTFMDIYTRWQCTQECECMCERACFTECMTPAWAKKQCSSRVSSCFLVPCCSKNVYARRESKSVVFPHHSFHLLGLVSTNCS